MREPVLSDQIATTASIQASQATNIGGASEPPPFVYIVGLSVLATIGLVAMWWVFWSAVSKSKESVHEVLMSSSFFRVTTVMGVIAATVVLSLAGRLEGNITGAILSGIVGYVLGQMASPARTPKSEDSAKHGEQDK
jgi:hypothetical protein